MAFIRANSIIQKLKKKRRSSFAKRLTRRVLLTLLVVMSGVSYLIYELASSFIEAEEGMKYETLLGQECEYVRRTLTHVKVAAENSVYVIEQKLDQPDQLQKLVERIVRDNKSMRSCGISFVANYYPGKGRLFMPYAERLDDSTIVARDKGQSIGNYVEEDWFTNVVQSDSGCWSKPFLGGRNGRQPQMAYMLPIHDRQGRVVAVVGADFSLNLLRAKLKKFDAQKNTFFNEDKEDGDTVLMLDIYSFIIDRQGNYVVHPDSSRILKDNFLAWAKTMPDTTLLHIGHLMVEGHSGHVRRNKEEEDLMINDQASHVFFASVPNTELSIGMVVPDLSIALFGYVLGGILLFLILIGLIVVWVAIRFGIRKMVRPLKQLTLSAEEVAKGNFSTPLPEIKKNDEIRLLRDSFEEMQHSLTRYVADLQTATAQNASIERELSIAHDIQMGMLPKKYPPYPERSDIDIYGSLTPAKSVGGDLFDFYIRDEHLFFCIGDVSGKGVPASLVMAVTRSLFRNISTHVASPNIIVSALNDAISQDNEENMFVTLFVGVLDLHTGILQYCNAGHNEPLLIGRGIGLLPCDANLPVGVMQGWNFTIQEIDIAGDTTIFLYTDGLTEAENAVHEQFGEERMLRAAGEQLDQVWHQPRPLIAALTRAVTQFVAGAEQSDDLTMLAIQYKKIED